MSALREAIYRIRNHEATGMVGAENLARLAGKELAKLEFELRRAIEANSGFVKMNNLHIRRIAELEDALQEIKQWGEAYPLEEPKIKLLNKETVTLVLLRNLNVSAETVGVIVNLVWKSDELLANYQLNPSPEEEK